MTECQHQNVEYDGAHDAEFCPDCGTWTEYRDWVKCGNPKCGCGEDDP